MGDIRGCLHDRFEGDHWHVPSLPWRIPIEHQAWANHAKMGGGMKKNPCAIGYMINGNMDILLLHLVNKSVELLELLVSEGWVKVIRIRKMAQEPLNFY